MLWVFKEKTSGSNYREKASYCPTKDYYVPQLRRECLKLC